MKRLIVAALVALSMMMPAQSQELQPREVIGIVAGAIIGYHIMQRPQEPRVIYQPVYQQQSQAINLRPSRQPYCYLREAWPMVGQGPVYVQECKYY